MRTFNRKPVRSFRFHALVAGVWLPLAALGVGCQTNKPAEHAANPALRQLNIAPDASSADADRAALARFIGVWNFEGWSADPGGKRSSASGHTAGTIEDEHFVLLDFQVTSGELTGRAGRKAGSMILASEPGIGATMTAWGDSGPSITRLVGRVEGNGSAFSFRESRTPEGRRRVSLLFVFETDDSWTVEIRDDSVNGDPVVASYRFTRAT